MEIYLEVSFCARTRWLWTFSSCWHRKPFKTQSNPLKVLMILHPIDEVATDYMCLQKSKKYFFSYVVVTFMYTLSKRIWLITYSLYLIWKWIIWRENNSRTFFFAQNFLIALGSSNVLGIFLNEICKWTRTNNKEWICSKSFGSAMFWCIWCQSANKVVGY